MLILKHAHKIFSLISVFFCLLLVSFVSNYVNFSPCLPNVFLQFYMIVNVMIFLIFFSLMVYSNDVTYFFRLVCKQTFSFAYLLSVIALEWSP